ncbi:hypothetical protein REPUB_Repub12eG0217300 [Reevesia pubescens]
MRNVLAQIWKLKKGLSITEIGDKIFMFSFGCILEKTRILQTQPWSFNKALLVLKEIDNMVRPDSLEMKWCPFWIQVHGLLAGLISEKVGIAIGESLGAVEQIDVSDSS